MFTSLPPCPFHPQTMNDSFPVWLFEDREQELGALGGCTGWHGPSIPRAFCGKLWYPHLSICEFT